TIPRGSKEEEQIRKYVIGVAERSGLKYRTDDAGNVVVRKPGTKGHEKAAVTILQSHLDMVNEKNSDVVHDFSTDAIRPVLDGEYLTADGTTLGSDNGIGVAAMLAILEAQELTHGPLEFLFTVDEETGLTGASNLASDSLESRTLMNLDSEEEGALYVGCSGGKNTVAAWKLNRDPVPAKHAGAIVTVKGLRGGHSGLEIHKGRGNAIKILGRVLLELADSGARMSAIEGGNKHNAIPREAESTVLIPTKNWEEAVNRVEKIEKVLREEVSSVDPDLAVTIEQIKGKRGKVIKKAQQRKVLAALAAMPHGVIKMSADIPGLVETSTNLAVIRTTRKGIEVATSQRSSVASEIDEICQTVMFIFDLAGADVEARGGYPGWKPNLGSEILAVAKSTYQSMYGNEPEVKAIHAGLECGIIGEKYPGMDMVSLGPTLEEVHSPDERIHIDSVERYWNYLIAILRNVN
ncbi:MAG: aminoacyl-histidine dipeptidase, partial [Bacteroidetes bacterium]|nr:aminoacyl-histidine dipeptidase [Bacteroidota bacterium]